MKKRLLLGIFVMFAVVLASGFVFAQDAESGVCCETTVSGLTCQNVPSDQCASGSQQTPTSCDQTSFCKEGFCYNPLEGTCASATAKLTCEDSGGVWSEDFPQQCQLGCCILGDRAAFTTQVQCNSYADGLGLPTNYDSTISNEEECVLSVAGQEKGACVFDENLITTCEFTTRDVCQNAINGDFSAGLLCTNSELNTNCLPTTQTTLVSGRDEVFFRDSCGNPANIFDSSKSGDTAYWSIIFNKIDSCNFDDPEGNAGSTSCGNCDYTLGSVGRETTGGGNQCVDLDCSGQGTEILGGQTTRNHRESWCVTHDEGDAVGSRSVRYSCQNGEVVSEFCEEFKQESCLEVQTDSGSEAVCRVNQWRDCTEQINQTACEDVEFRDCQWKELTQTAGTFAIVGNSTTNGACLPKEAPGLDFWNPDGEAAEVCSLGVANCVVTFERGAFDSSASCEKNCHCQGAAWERERVEICTALGDCGPRLNWDGGIGGRDSYTIVRGEGDISRLDVDEFLG